MDEATAQQLAAAIQVLAAAAVAALATRPPLLAPPHVSLTKVMPWICPLRL